MMSGTGPEAPSPPQPFSQILTPADTDEHPLAKLVCRVGENNGCVEVAALAKHPEEVGDMEIIVGSYDQTAPDLPWQQSAGVKEGGTQREKAGLSEAVPRRDNTSISGTLISGLRPAFLAA